VTRATNEPAALQAVQQRLREDADAGAMRRNASRHPGPQADLVTEVFRGPESIRNFDPASWTC